MPYMRRASKKFQHFNYSDGTGSKIYKYRLMVSKAIKQEAKRTHEVKVLKKIQKIQCFSAGTTIIQYLYKH